MDDAAHAHPHSPAATLPRPRSTTTLSLREQHPAHSTPRSVPHTRQQRLLSTRHARFSAQSLSVNGLTIPFARPVRSSENESPHYSSTRFIKREEDGDNTGKSADVRDISSRSSILDEITNSVYRVRDLQKRAPIPVFQGSPARSCTKDVRQHTPSIYQDASGEFQTPSVTGSTPESPSMGLREVSVNLPRSSPHKESPSYRSIRNSPRRKTSLAKPRFNSEEYIEHIENELQMVKDAMYSPTTNISWKEKLKKAKDENDRLLKEIEITRVSFELELRATVERSAETEMKLKRKIKDLEDEVDLKRTVIQDLEIDREEKRIDQTTMEALRARIDKLEEEKVSLEFTNMDMMKRNEVLTQLLALSPTKTQQSFQLPTPRRKSARPMSMIIPRMESSPSTRTPTSRPQSVLVSPALPIADYFPINVASSPIAENHYGLSGPSLPGSDDVESVRSGTSISYSQATDVTDSRRLTMASQASGSPGTVPINSTDMRPPLLTRHASKRRPRKFMQGSTQLKPLLLPTFTADNGNLPSTSPITSPKRQFPTPIAGPSYRYSLSISRSTTTDVSNSSAPSSPTRELSDQPGPSLQNLDQVFAQEEATFQGEAINEALAKLTQKAHDAQYHTPIQQIHSKQTVKASSFGTPGSRPRVNSWLLRTSTTGCDAEDFPLNTAGDRLGARNCLVIDDSPDTISGAIARDFGDLRASTVGHVGDHIDIPRPLFSKEHGHPGGPYQSPSYYDQSPLNPRKRRKADSICKDRHSEDDDTDESALKKPAESEITRQVLTPSSVLQRAGEPAANRHQHPAKGNQGAARPRNPLELLQQRNIGSKTLAAITIRTVYATLTRYTSYIQSFKRDPLALARRVIANAWRANWGAFGKLSWWVLGLFLGHRTVKHEPSEWDWEQYDGESIADRCCDRTPAETGVEGDERPLHEPSHEQSANTRTKEPPDAVSASMRKDTKSSWGKSLYLWGKFSVAIMLAVGGAIVKGPAEMLRETEERRRSRQNSIASSQGSRERNQTSMAAGTAEHSRRLDQKGQEQPRGHITGHDAYQTREPVRLRRSHSSPTPSPRAYRFDTTVAEHNASTTGAQVAADPPDAVEIPLTPAHGHGLVDETLKPMRSGRKGLDSVFAPQGDETPGPYILAHSTAISSKSVLESTNQFRRQIADNG
ncbi:hypothetical protein LTR06_007302 [Exophiala xenobiotica]|nr:hypothetical protein LTR06_007302 [Exophiala xenobiotica]